MNKLALATMGVAFCVTALHADTITFDTSFLTDAKQPASSTALFSYSGGNTVTLTLTDTTANPISDAPNLADFAFQMPSTVTGISNASGNTITIGSSGTTTGSFNGTSPWSLTSGSSGWWTNPGAPGVNVSGNYFDIYATPTSSTPGPGGPGGPGPGPGGPGPGPGGPGGPGPGPGGPGPMPAPGACGNCTAAPFSIVGSNPQTPAANGKNPDIGSADLFSTGVDGTMFNQSATFTLTLSTPMTTSQFDSLANSVVVFGYGPDGPNTPDGDDISAGTPGILCTTCNPPPCTVNCGPPPCTTNCGPSTVPEPSSMGLVGLGLCGAAIASRRFGTRKQGIL